MALGGGRAVPFHLSMARSTCYDFGRTMEALEKLASALVRRIENAQPGRKAVGRVKATVGKGGGRTVLDLARRDCPRVRSWIAEFRRMWKGEDPAVLLASHIHSRCFANFAA